MDRSKVVEFYSRSIGKRKKISYENLKYRFWKEKNSSIEKKVIESRVLRF